MRKYAGLLICLFLIALCTAAFASVTIDETFFPDPAFRTLLTRQLGKQEGDTISDDEIDGITELNFFKYNLHVADLTGIEHFQNLTRLIAGNTNHNDAALTSVDLSHNTKLTFINLRFQKLTELDVSMCKALDDLSISDNNLTKLNVSMCESLRELDVSYNNLTELILPGNSALKLLDCPCNSLTSLDLSGCTSLQSLYCGANNISSLDVSATNCLRTLSCGSNPLQSLTLTGSLKNLYCINTPLTTLNIYNCPTLIELSQREPEHRYDSVLGKYYLSYNTSSYTMNTDEGVTFSTDPPYVPEFCAITFDANGGKGEMDPVTVEKGTEYTLPECAFTAPYSSVFTGWDQGKAGEKITVTEDAVLKAQWKIVRSQTKITAANKTFKAKTKTKKYTVTLKDKKGKAIAKANLTLKVNGVTYKATTNSKGKATFKITKLKKAGKFKATITFKGDTYFKKATKKVTITVKK